MFLLQILEPIQSRFFLQENTDTFIFILNFLF